MYYIIVQSYVYLQYGYTDYKNVEHIFYVISDDMFDFIVDNEIKHWFMIDLKEDKAYIAVKENDASFAVLHGFDVKQTDGDAIHENFIFEILTRPENLIDNEDILT